MIIAGDMPPELKRISRSNYLWFSTINAFSYMCLGETMIILFAVKLGMSNFVISVIGALIYIGFVMLPLGKFLAGRIGAVRSQMTFWTIRSFVSLGIVCAAPVALYVSPPLATAMVLVGTCIFYGMRAAGVVMGTPLLNDITDGHSQNRYISQQATYFYLATMLALIVISLLLRLSDSIWMLAGVISGGATLGITAAHFLKGVHETTKLGEAARRPVGSDARALFRERPVRRLLAGNLTLNLAMALIAPISMLALKRGWGVSDSNALYYSLAQFAASALFSSFSPPLVRKTGPRRTAFAAFVLLLLAGCMWLAMPPQASPFLLAIPFLLIGMAAALTNNSMVHYFLQTVKKEKLVAGSILSSVLVNTGAGVIGMAISGVIWQILAAAGTAGTQTYFWYFLIVLLVLLPGAAVLLAMVPLPVERRLMKRRRARLR